eukprot:1547029-Amphidinium_carterae.1
MHGPLPTGWTVDTTSHVTPGTAVGQFAVGRSTPHSIRMRLHTAHEYGSPHCNHACGVDESSGLSFVRSFTPASSTLAGGSLQPVDEVLIIGPGVELGALWVVSSDGSRRGTSEIASELSCNADTV